MVCTCCNSSHQQARTYFEVWDNRIEFNSPCTLPYMCCTTSEKCVADRVKVQYFDRSPTRSGTCCLCLPCSLCGPPVIFAVTPKILCVDLSDCCGQQIMCAPCNCRGLRVGLFCCFPCYRFWACPMVSGAKEAGKFLFLWEKALEEYFKKHGLPEHHMAKFDKTVDAFISPLDGSDA